MDYFDESLFDIGFPPTPSTGNNIPVTLGSISTASNNNDSRTGSLRSYTWTDDMPRSNLTSSPIIHSEPQYANVAVGKVLNNVSDKYRERNEGHYARLVEVTDTVPRTARVAVKPKQDGLNFYVQKAAEQRARSRSRGPERGRERSRSTRRSDQPRSKSRGCSASRDIMALYTNRPVSGYKLRNESSSPERDTNSYPRRRQSISPSNRSNKTSEQPKTLSPRASGPTNKSVALHNKRTPSYINHQNRSTPETRSKQYSESDSFMTLLEMDTEKIAQIEQELLESNSVKPANIKMMMIANHMPTKGWASKDEATAKTGEIVTALYKQNEWLCVVTEQKQVGFVPYSYTKPVKVTQAKPVNSPSKKTKPVTGILKTSSFGRQKQRRSHPKFSVKVRTAADNDSLSSETSSLMMDDFVYTRKRSSNSSSHADCMVIDTDDIMNSKLEPPTNIEETGTYCSDSGISDPNSNHSDDLDPLHSPISLSDELHDSGIVNVPLSTPRLPNERIVSVTTELLAHSGKINSPHDSRPHSRASAPISDMPLGPLGARLARLNVSKPADTRKTVHGLDNIKPTKAIASDMKSRAQSSSSTPASVRPEIPKDYGGPRVTVVFDYEGGNDDDLVVHASDVVTVLNGEDVEWIWVQRRDGKEGFIPKEYVIPLELSSHNRRRVGISLL